ncbi:MAG TPA: histidine kinase dimerization/phospho-acceptor domain-containing protein [Terriglobales bacterium]
MKQATVLIISDDAVFSNAITARWQAELSQPAFTLMSSDLCHHLDANTFDLAVVGELKANASAFLAKAFSTIQKPSIFIVEKTAKREIGLWTKVLHKAKDDHSSDWLESLILLASETLLYSKAIKTVHKLEQEVGLLERQAALGNFMLDMRHNLNNALTSILGNSELLLLDGENFSSGVRMQVETIRNMSVRIHEILQRFSSLEKELTIGEEQARPKNRGNHQVNAAKA